MRGMIRFRGNILESLNQLLIRLYSHLILVQLSPAQKRVLNEKFQERMVLLTQIRKYSKYSLGEWSYGEPKIIDWGQEADLKIGKFCSFATGVKILLGGEHRTDCVTTYPFSLYFRKAHHLPKITTTKGSVVIGNDVWVGQDTMILSGVTIGNGAVIGARSIIAKNVKPYSITVGSPAKHVRFRFSEATIEALERIAWWDWPLEEIERAWPFLLSNKIDEFVKRYDQ